MRKKNQRLSFLVPVALALVNSTSYKRTGNVFMWVGLIMGTGIMMCLYGREWYARQNCPNTMVSCHCSGAPTTPLWACDATPCGGSRPSDTFLSRSEGLVHAEGASTRSMIASGGALSEGYGHGGPGVCLGDGQTEAEGVPS